MNAECSITQQLLQRQQTMFRKAAEEGFSQKVIAIDAGLSLSAVGQYARGETAMSGPSILKVRRAIGPQLISILFDDGDYLVPSDAELDYDTFAAGCIEFAAAHAKARHPESPGGVDIVDVEKPDLDGSAVRLRLVG